MILFGITMTDTLVIKQKKNLSDLSGSVKRKSYVERKRLYPNRIGLNTVWTQSLSKMIIVEFANNGDPDEEAQNEPPPLDLH